jgi:hypothetical protein
MGSAEVRILSVPVSLLLWTLGHPQAVRSKLIIATFGSDVAQGKSGGLIGVSRVRERQMGEVAKWSNAFG